MARRERHRPRVPRVLRLDDPRRRRARVAVALLLAGSLGASTASLRGPEPARAAAEALQGEVTPLIGELDVLWSSGRDDRPAIGEAFERLRATGTAPGPAAFEAWFRAHDSLLVRIVGADLPVEARAVQRQAVLAVTLSRDAVEALERAGAVGPGAARSELLAAAVRSRIRSEQISLTVLASIDDLAGSRRRLAPLPALPTFAELIR